MSHTEPQKSAAHFCLITRIFNQGGRGKDEGVDTVGVYVWVFCACLLTCVHKMRVCYMFVFAGEMYVLCGFISLIGRFRMQKVKQGEEEGGDSEKIA